MAIDILFRSNPVEIDDLILDAALSEDHTSEVELTDNPVETGVNITDHKRKRPAQVTITGVISNTPLELFNFTPGQVDRDAFAWGVLKGIQGANRLITIVTTLQTYENMQIVSLTAPRNAQLGNTLEFTAVCREVFTAESQTIAAPEVERPPVSKQGVKPTSAPSAPTSTLANNIFNALSF